MNIKPVINYYMRVNGSQHIIEHIDTHESGDYILRQLFSESDKGYRQHKFEFEQEYQLVDKSVVDALERQTCGRRVGEFGPWEHKEGLDHWKVLPNGDKVRSFCGSLHPDTVLQIVKERGFGAIERSTKSYKWYINRPEVSNASEGGIKYYRHHDTQAFIDSYNRLVNSGSEPQNKAHT